MLMSRSVHLYKFHSSSDQNFGHTGSVIDNIFHTDHEHDVDIFLINSNTYLWAIKLFNYYLCILFVEPK